MSGVGMKPHNTFPFINIGFHPTWMPWIPNHVKTIILKNMWNWNAQDGGQCCLWSAHLFTMPRGGWSSCCTTWDTHPKSKMASTIRLLGHGTKWYVCCNNSGGVILVHNHYNQCAWDRTSATSTKMGWPNQPWTWSHAIKTYSRESPKGWTFSKR